MKANTQAEERSARGEAAATPQPMVTAAAPAPHPATAAVALPPHPLLPPRFLVARLGRPPHGGRGNVAALRPTGPAAAAAVTAHTGIAARRAGTGGGAAQIGQVATRKTVAIPGIAGVTGVDPGPEREAGAEAEIAAVAAETERGKRTEIRREKGAGSAETAVTVIAVNTSRRPQVKTEREEGKGVGVMRKTRKRRIRTKIGKRRWIKRKKRQRPKRRKREAH